MENELFDQTDNFLTGTPGDGSIAFRSRPAASFNPGRIVLAKGSMATRERCSLAEAICAAYPDASVTEALQTPHNRIELQKSDLLTLHYEGKQTLVLGEHRSAVRLSSETGNTCPNYWHFSPYGFCPYDCKYCYLAGTRGVMFSPTVKVFMNLEEILLEIDGVSSKFKRPTAFYLGKLQDGLALDSLTGYSRLLVRFFAHHKIARQVVLTKSADVQNLLGLDHCQRTILSWSLSPLGVWDEFESGTPSPAERIEAMRQCAAAGYPVRAVLMPIVPVSKWKDQYAQLLCDLLEEVHLDRITLGGVCSFSNALQLTEAKMGKSNAISTALAKSEGRSSDGRCRYALRHRVEMYRQLIEQIRDYRADLEIGLCLEEPEVFESLGITSAIGRCNCIL